MRFILEIQTSAQAGRRVWLSSGQTLDVGRTERAEFVVPDDGYMSGLHFALEFVEGACRIRDLGSSNGTFVNGQRVEKALLCHGDEIVAGQTRFLVHQESPEVAPGGSGPANGPSAAALAPQPAEPPAAEPAADSRRRPPPAPWRVTQPLSPSDVLAFAERIELSLTEPPREPPNIPERPVPEVQPVSAPGARPSERPSPGYLALDCPSGLTLFRGAEPAFQASAIARAVGLAAPAYLVVDLRALRGGVPPGTAEPQALFDWLPPPLAAASPVIVGPEAGDERFAMIDQGWGKNALVCVYSNRAEAEVVADLRELAGGKGRLRGAALEGEILGACSPSILAPILSNGSRRFAERIFARLDAVFLEVHGGQRWGVFARREFTETLRRAGLAPVEGYDDLANVPR